MVSALTEHVFARKDGKELIVAGWMKKLVNVFQIARGMDDLTLKPSSVFVRKIGSVMIVHLDYVALIVGIMAGNEK